MACHKNPEINSQRSARSEFPRLPGSLRAILRGCCSSPWWNTSSPVPERRHWKHCSTSGILIYSWIIRGWVVEIKLNSPTTRDLNDWNRLKPLVSILFIGTCQRLSTQLPWSSGFLTPHLQFLPWLHKAGARHLQKLINQYTSWHLRRYVSRSKNRYRCTNSHKLYMWTYLFN